MTITDEEGDQEYRNQGHPEPGEQVGDVGHPDMRNHGIDVRVARHGIRISVAPADILAA